MKLNHAIQGLALVVVGAISLGQNLILQDAQTPTVAETNVAAPADPIVFSSDAPQVATPSNTGVAYGAPQVTGYQTTYQECEQWVKVKQKVPVNVPVMSRPVTRYKAETYTEEVTRTRMVPETYTEMVTKTRMVPTTTMEPVAVNACPTNDCGTFTQSVVAGYESWPTTAQVVEYSTPGVVSYKNKERWRLLNRQRRTPIKNIAAAVQRPRKPVNISAPVRSWGSGVECPD